MTVFYSLKNYLMETMLNVIVVHIINYQLQLTASVSCA